MKVCLLSFSDIGSDWRIRRHAQLLLDLGHDVRTVGLPSMKPGGLPWPAEHVVLPGWTLREKATQALHLATVRLRATTAETVYWRSARHRAMYEAARRGPVADLYVANDWNTLPIAARLATGEGGRYAYDTHEYAVEEHADRARWRLVWPPFLRALEAKHIGDAVWVSTVSEGIAALLQEDHHLTVRPSVIRNVPPYQEMQLREAAGQVTVLFHGGLLGDRGLEPLIDSVPQWSPHFRLVIRGNGDEAYVAALRRRADATGQGGRINFEQAVPHDRVVQAANETADIGIHPMSTMTRQTRFAMPNKFFEYTMAGLAVCVVSGSEMARSVEELGHGVLLPAADPDSISQTINALNYGSINAYKAKSLTAARSLSWVNEQLRLAALYPAVAP